MTNHLYLLAREFLTRFLITTVNKKKRKSPGSLNKKQIDRDIVQKIHGLTFRVVTT